MKKVSFLTILFLILVAGCQSPAGEETLDETQDQFPEEIQEDPSGEIEEEALEQTEDVVMTVEEIQKIWEEGETSFETQSPLVGIGDTHEAFLDFFGEPDQAAGTYYTFFDGYMHTYGYIVDELKVMGVSLQFDVTDHPERTLEEALEEIAAFIPTDAELLDSYEIQSGHGVEYYYESDYIAEVFKDETIFEIEEPGGFGVQVFYSPNSQKERFDGVVVTVGYKDEGIDEDEE